MSAERKIAIFDPDERLQLALKGMFQACEKAKVVASACTVEEAERELERLQAGECDFFLINGEMTHRPPNYAEGEALAERIKQLGLGVVIGISLENLDGADFNISPTRTGALMALGEGADPESLVHVA